MTSLLITQCLQNDFVKRLDPDESLPNILHIGHEESRRLLGDNIENGPINRFMQWVAGTSEMYCIHIRDWHDPSSPDQARHLEQFGSHCIQNTQGADFIFDEGDSNVTVIDSTILNDFVDTALAETLNQFVDDSIRVGIIGVWTEAKVLFLAYELSTRYPNFEIAVCSALTASSSRSQHFLALKQLEKIVGVQVIDSVGEFIHYLGGYDARLPIAFNQSLEVQIEGGLDLSDEDDQLIRYLFRDCNAIKLKVLDGGFSGNLVAAVTGFDVHGHEQAPHVIKIGCRKLMAKERSSFEQIEMVLGNNAPAIAEYADLVTRGAIKYRYASMGSAQTKSLQDHFQQGVSLKKIYGFLDDLFDDQMGRFYRAAVSEKLDLLEYYCFSSQWSESVKRKIEELLGQCPETGSIQLPGDRQIDNLYRFYKSELDLLPSFLGDYPVAFVHGDLNGANVVIDAKENVWLIDFFHTHRGHVLKDFVKLENDILYICTPVMSQTDLKLAYDFTDFILEPNVFELPPNLPKNLLGSQFERTYNTILYIRKKAKPYSKNDNAELSWLLAQLRYAVHTIGFDEPNHYQRIWALYTAASIAKKIRA